jgi:hypothetical protein
MEEKSKERVGIEGEDNNGDEKKKLFFLLVAISLIIVVWEWKWSAHAPVVAPTKFRVHLKSGDEPKIPPIPAQVILFVIQAYSRVENINSLTSHFN